MEGEADGIHFELMALKDGRPIYYITQNVNAAISTGVNLIRNTPPYNLDGSGLTVGIWDAGGVLPTHQEFDSRVNIMDGTATHWHSTHVGGTIGASGVQPAAMGMAPNVDIDSYDWDYDDSEMASRAASYPGEPGKIYLSNHSYGIVTGWTIGDYSGNYGYHWFGTWGDREDEGFGQYNELAVSWDTVCYSAPYYLPFNSAGNDRDDSAPGDGTPFYYIDGGEWQSKSYNSSTDPYWDNWDNGGFDTLSHLGNAKNIMTVGAVSDAVLAGQRSISAAMMTSFSSWGPTDDGRIKPDIVANGTGLYSTIDDSNTSYDTFSGTSMSAPNASGSAGLLIQLYCRLFPGQAMLASTLKALIMHTADDLGNAGPDYSFGWGLMNAYSAANLIMDHNEHPAAGKMIEGLLNTANPNDSYVFIWNGETAIRATLCWTDPPATALSGLDNPSPRLVNDLDLRIIGPNGIDTYYPFVLDRINPANPATTGDNVLDNVEQVYIASVNVPGVYTALVEHKGTLTDGEQNYSLIITGQHTTASSAGTIKLDKDSYSCDDSVGVEVRDGDLEGSGSCNVSVFTSGADVETLTLYEDTFRDGIFAGAIATSSDTVVPGDGLLQVANGQTITAEYQDADDGSGSPATPNDVAEVDCEPPIILNVQVLDITSSAATIEFETNEPTTATITYGPDCEEPNGLLEDMVLSTEHSFYLSYLIAETDYYFAITASDEVGNTTTDDNAGLCYQFTTTAEPGGIHVPADYATIQEAINAAVDGNIIIVADGIYTGSGNRDIDFMGKEITVKSENGPANCTIDCQGSLSAPHRGFRFDSGEDSNSILSGFTIINGFGPTAAMIGYYPAGGAIFCKDSSPTIEDCVFRNNEADERISYWGRGGAIACTYSSAIIKDCTFENNHAYDGGGLYTERNSAIITGCTFTGNIASNGGGLESREAAILIENSVFNNNCVTGYGGGIYCDGASISDVFNGGDTIIISNCVIYDNVAYNPGMGSGITGGIEWSPNWYDVMKVVNCTVVNNWAEAAGGIRGGFPGDINVTNCIVRGNSPGQLVKGNGSMTATYSNIQDSFPGEGNIDADPYFVSATDYHLTAESPCIDTGTNSALTGFPPTDFDGKPRPLDGDADQTDIADMGAYEFWSGPSVPFIAIDCSELSFTTAHSVPEQKLFLLRNGWAGILNWQITEDCQWLEVSPTSGVSTGDVNEVTVTADATGLPDGIYTCQIIISDQNATNDPQTLFVELHVGYLKVPLYYPTIGQAVDAAFDGDVIIVADGVYTGEDNRNMNIQGKRLTIVSENGPAICIIDCQGTGRGFYIDGPDTNGTIIRGFTITNGLGDEGGGIYCESSSPVIENCRIIGCASVGDLPDAGGLYFYNYCDPVIKNCVISGNSGFRGGGMYFYTYCNPQILNCLITNNHADDCGGGIGCKSDCSIYTANSTFAENTAPSGGAIHNGTNNNVTVVNCILWGNLPNQIWVPSTAAVTYSDVQGGYAGTGNINADPCFATGPNGDYYLSQTAAGQAVDSLCVDSGSDTAASLGMDAFTTRTDRICDVEIVDMGYHYHTDIDIIIKSADIDENWNVDLLDFAILAADWLECSDNLNSNCTAGPLPGDIFRDYYVNMHDLALLVESWLDCLVTPAEGPIPVDEAVDWEPNVTLGWTAGAGALEHDVYLGTDDNAVAGASHLSGEFIEAVLDVNFGPCLLDVNTTYFWRIDEVGPVCITKGDVWSFTTWQSGDIDPNLVGWWKFDEGTGSTAHDSAGSNDGNIIGATWTIGKINSALDFNGLDDYVDLGTNPYAGLTEGTISAWIKPVDTVYRRMVIGAKEGTDDLDYMSFELYNGQLQVWLIHASASLLAAVGETLLQTDTWHHIAYTTDSSGHHFYVNGEPETVMLYGIGDPGTNAFFGHLPTEQVISIGVLMNYNGENVDHFDGKIDDVRIYDRALSEEEVEQLYQKGL